MEGNERFAYRLEDYHYDLPPSLIAQTAPEKREASRLLVLDRSTSCREHRRFEEVGNYLEPGDVVVVNDTRVVPARLTGQKETGGRVELLVLAPFKDPDTAAEEGFECLVKAAKRPKPGNLIAFGETVQAEVLTPVTGGVARFRFLGNDPLLQILDRVGEVPLPPYIYREPGHGRDGDFLAYQTVYACKPGAVAAPTAGLHFSNSLLEKLAVRGVELVNVTLHVGYGTFAPLRVEDVREHRMHPEYAEISEESAEKIERARNEGRRIIAVGTTVVRTLEWVAQERGMVTPFVGFCNHYIYPGYRFRIIDAMITNFHLPKSTLLLLVSAFAGRESILNAYREAIEERYRFFSYGDAMLIL